MIIKKVFHGGYLVEKIVGAPNETILTLDFTSSATLVKAHHIGKEPTGYEIITSNQYANIFLLDKNEHNVTFKCDTEGTIMKVRVF